MEEVKIAVFGEPQPAGSKTPGRTKSGKLYVRDANPKSREWKDRVAAEAAKVYDGPILTGPLEIEMDFYRLRPKGHYGTGRNAEHLKDSAPLHPTVVPDATKYGRGAEDALTGIVYRDDAQVVDLHLRKHYGEPARIEIVVRTMESASVGEQRQRSLLAT